jgi:tetratricopeptide (TPR) repeat protein
MLMGKIQDAIKDFYKVVQKNPDHLESHLALGQCFIYLQDLPNAQEHFAHVVERDPTNAAAHEGLSIYYTYQNTDFNKAVEHLNICINNPKDGKHPKNRVNLYLKRASVYIQMNEVFKALEDLNFAEKIDNTNSFLYGLRGEAYYKIENFESCIKDYDKYLEITKPSTEMEQEQYNRIKLEVEKLKK